MACPVPEGRLDEMADAAAEAFIAAADPVCRFLFEEEPGRLDLTRAYFRMIVRECADLSIKLREPGGRRPSPPAPR